MSGVKIRIKVVLAPRYRHGFSQCLQCREGGTTNWEVVDYHAINDEGLIGTAAKQRTGGLQHGKDIGLLGWRQGLEFRIIDAIQDFITGRIEGRRNLSCNGPCIDLGKLLIGGVSWQQARSS